MRTCIQACVKSLHKIKMYYTCGFLSSCSTAYFVKQGNEIGLTLLFIVESCISYCSSISQAAFQAACLQRYCSCCLCVFSPCSLLGFHQPWNTAADSVPPQVLSFPYASVALVHGGSVWERNCLGITGFESCWGCHVWNQAEEAVRTGMALSCDG